MTVRARATGLIALLAAVLSGCASAVPTGKAWTVDTQPWVGSIDCPADDCALPAYASRDFSLDATVPLMLRTGDTVQVHCFVPTPAPQRDPSGRDAHRWYLLSVDDDLLWAPDVTLTAEDDLRASPTSNDGPTESLAAGLELCHSAVPGR